MVLHHTDGLNLSNSCVSVAFLFLITRLSTDQSNFMGYPSEDCRWYSIDNDVGDEPLREAMKNILVVDIKPKHDDVQVIDPPSSSNVPQDGDKDGRIENEDTHVSHD